ncbi:MAG: hypothetical protein NTZ05_13525, partial [Chloroflexi bacterium]|nr:hypothetical protein [Chloroflexota bacterium]
APPPTRPAPAAAARAALLIAKPCMMRPPVRALQAACATMEQEGPAVLHDFVCGVHLDVQQVHLGFGGDGVDLPPVEFRKLMEAISDFDMEIILLEVHGMEPRAGVVAYGITVQWDSDHRAVRMQCGGITRLLSPQQWGQLMSSLRTLLGCVTRWQRGAVLPKELNLPGPVNDTDSAAAVEEAERFLRETRAR